MIRRTIASYTDSLLYRRSLHLLIDLAIGIALFTAAVTLFSTALGLTVTVVGIPLLALTVWGGRGVAAFERVRFRTLLGEHFPEWPALQWGTGWWARLKQALTDRPGWKGLLYSVVMLPWGILTFTLTVTLWSLTWGLVLSPLWALWSEPPPTFHLGTTRIESTGWVFAGELAVATLLGLALVVLLPKVMAALARTDAALARALLAPTEAELLKARVGQLEESRDASVASAAGELRRIERDLHDGAQQRMVSVAMQLGMAKERLEQVDDPKARELVAQAHDEAKLAIAELRDLVRGIHPAVLTDRGLDAAVSALAARCPVPVEVRSELDGHRLAAHVEATAYFVVAEALTNVAKHSGAQRARVALMLQGDRLVVEVADDGVGGAAEGTTGGLHGLHERVRAVEGRLRVASPAGGPTTIIVEVPCES